MRKVHSRGHRKNAGRLPCCFPFYSYMFYFLNTKALNKHHARITAFFILICTSTIYLFYVLHGPSLKQVQHPPVVVEPWDSSNFVLGPPTAKFRDNLRNDTFYITTWTDAGFTNEFMTYVNMIYLGLISDRVPVIPPFEPFHHVSTSAGLLAFGLIFDLPHLRSTLRRPLLEWHDLKTTTPSPSNSYPLGSPHPPPLTETIGCWSSWMTGNPKENKPIDSKGLVEHLRLDVAYTPSPREARRLPQSGEEWDWHLLFWPLAASIFPTKVGAGAGGSAGASASRRAPPPAPPATVPSPLGHRSPPDTHLACFDLLYFVTASVDDYEWDRPWSPAWREVGRHLRFSEDVVEVAGAYLRRAFGRGEGEGVPDFIAVHIRHGDFSGSCWEAETPADCWAPFSTYVKRVRQVQAELWATRGIVVPDRHVLVTSDDTDPQFWSQVTAHGWALLDHTAEETLETYGEWFLTIIDVAAQSLAVGFVGTDRSTVSIVSRRRVEEWNAGVTRTVRWGRRGADDEPEP